MSPKTKNLVLGIAMILAALAGAVVYFLDGNPETVVKPGEVIESVMDGIDVMKNEVEEIGVAPEGEVK